MYQTGRSTPTINRLDAHRLGTLTDGILKILTAEVKVSTVEDDFSHKVIVRHEIHSITIAVSAEVVDSGGLVAASDGEADGSHFVSPYVTIIQGLTGSSRANFQRLNSVSHTAGAPFSPRWTPCDTALAQSAIFTCQHSQFLLTILMSPRFSRESATFFSERAMEKIREASL